MRRTIEAGRRANRDRSWLWCAMLYLIATAPLARPADAAVEQKAAACEACHGPHGQSTNPTLPSLAGQTSQYINEQLRDFKTGGRHSQTMTPIAATLTPDDMQQLADYFSQQTPMSSAATDSTKIAQGKSIADSSLCGMCHEAGLTGQNAIPRVAGQQYAYIVEALKGFRDGRRTNDAGAMQSVVHGVSDQDLEALAQYVANLN